MKFFEDLSMLRKMGKKKEKNKIDSRVFFRVYRVFGRHYKPYIKVLVSSYMCLFLSIGMAVLEPWPLKIILDYIILGEPMPAMLSFLEPIVLIEPKLLLAFMALMIIVLATLGSIFSYINKFWVSSTGDRINADIRERTFAQLQRLSLSFHDSSRSGNLIYLLTSDNDRMKNLLIKFPQDFSQYLFTYLGYSIMLMLLDWKLALIALCTTPLLAIFTFMFGNGMKKAMSRRRKVEGEVASIIQENMSSMMLVQAYGRESSEFSRFEEQNRASLKEKLKFLKIFKSYSRVSDFMIVAAIAGVLYFGGVYALGGVILPGTLVVFVAYLQQNERCYRKAFSEVFMDLSKSLPGERMLELVENDDVVADDKMPKTAPAVRGDVTFSTTSGLLTGTENRCCKTSVSM
ncbi:MAG: ABC transporter ATP-binding protein [Calditrichia bacterium]